MTEQYTAEDVIALVERAGIPVADKDLYYEGFDTFVIHGENGNRFRGLYRTCLYGLANDRSLGEAQERAKRVGMFERNTVVKRIVDKIKDLPEDEGVRVLRGELRKCAQ